MPTGSGVVSMYTAGRRAKVRVYVSVLLFCCVACQGEPLVSGERFEISAVEEEEEEVGYCDDDDDDAREHVLTGKIEVFGRDGTSEHTGVVERFILTAALTCSDDKPASIALTPQDGGVTYLDESGAQRVAELSLVGLDAPLKKDPPVVHADHRLHTWFAHDHTRRVVLQKREELDDMWAADFHVTTYVLHDAAAELHLSRQ